MLEIKISYCDDCTSNSQLLEDIDCKIKEIAIDLYNNTIFALNRPINSSLFIDLINYRRIVTYRQYNEDYALPYTDEMIASKIKLLKFK